MTKAGDEQSRSRWEACLMMLPLILGGAVALLIGIRNLWLALNSTAWPTVQGVILVSELEHQDETTEAKIKYEYVVNNRRIEGKGVSYGDHGSSDSRHARGILLKYPKGKEVLVSYQPSNPERSVLEPGFNYGALGLPLVGLFFLIPPGFVVLFAPNMLAWVERSGAREKSALAADRIAFAGQWRLIFGFEDFEPPWRNAARYGNWRAQGSLVVLDVRDSKLIALPRKVWKEVIGLALFTPVFGAIPYFIGAPYLITGLFASFPLLIVAVLIVQLLLMKMLGYPLVIDRESRVVSLPPFLGEFPFSSVVAFQWIRSMELQSSEIKSDLNLLIRENGEIVRYSVLHEPTRSQIREILAFSGLALEELELDHKASRNIDCNTGKRFLAASDRVAR